MDAQVLGEREVDIVDALTVATASVPQAASSGTHPFSRQIVKFNTLAKAIQANDAHRHRPHPKRLCRLPELRGVC